MSFAEYWEGDASLTRYYREAFLLKQKRRERTDDFNAWLSGVYIHKAIAAVFCSTKTKKYEYPDKPLLQSAAEEANLSPEELEERRQDAGFAFLSGLVDHYGNNTAES